MSMEMTFIVTWGGAILLGVALGLLTYWVFEHDNKEDNHDGRRHVQSMIPPKRPTIPLCLCKNYFHWILQIGSPSKMLRESMFQSCKASEQYFDKYEKYQIAMTEYRIATRVCTRDEWYAYRRSRRRKQRYQNLKG